MISFRNQKDFAGNRNPSFSVRDQCIEIELLYFFPHILKSNQRILVKKKRL